jgi:hypothetical protein
MPTPPDPLDPLLDRWNETAAPLPGFTHEVWERISRERAREKDAIGLWAAMEVWLSRPPFAALFVVCCALMGLFLAELRVNRIQHEQSAQLVRSYVQLIDPLLATKAEVP